MICKILQVWLLAKACASESETRRGALSDSQSGDERQLPWSGLWLCVSESANSKECGVHKLSNSSRDRVPAETTPLWPCVPSGTTKKLLLQEWSTLQSKSLAVLPGGKKWPVQPWWLDLPSRWGVSINGRQRERYPVLITSFIRSGMD